MKTRDAEQEQQSAKQARRLRTDHDAGRRQNESDEAKGKKHQLSCASF